MKMENQSCKSFWYLSIQEGSRRTDGKTRTTRPDASSSQVEGSGAETGSNLMTCTSLLMIAMSKKWLGGGGGAIAGGGSPLCQVHPYSSSHTAKKSKMLAVSPKSDQYTWIPQQSKPTPVNPIDPSRHSQSSTSIQGKVSTTNRESPSCVVDWILGGPNNVSHCGGVTKLVCVYDTAWAGTVSSRNMMASIRVGIATRRIIGFAIAIDPCQRSRWQIAEHLMPLAKYCSRYTQTLYSM